MQQQQQTSSFNSEVFVKYVCLMNGSHQVLLAWIMTATVLMSLVCTLHFSRVMLNMPQLMYQFIDVMKRQLGALRGTFAH